MSTRVAEQDSPPGLGYAVDKGDRDNQEDQIGYRPLRSGVLAFALADGMGGHVGGEVASGLAVQAFLDHVGRYPAAGPDRWTAIMGEALLAANGAIRTRIMEDEQYRGMGCTFVGVISDGKRFSYCSVGDSPLFISSSAGGNGKGGGSRFIRVNTDHSMRTAIEEQSRKTGISVEELSRSINPNALRSALVGQDLDIEAMRSADELDLDTKPLNEGDRLFVASDGVDTLDRAVLARLAENRSRTVQALAGEIIEAVKACKKPGQDNTSLIVYAAAPPATRSRGLFGGKKPAVEVEDDPTQPIPVTEPVLQDAPENRDTKAIFIPPGNSARVPPAVAKLRLQNGAGRRRTTVLQWVALALGIGMLAAVVFKQFGGAEAIERLRQQAKPAAASATSEAGLVPAAENIKKVESVVTGAAAGGEAGSESSNEVATSGSGANEAAPVPR